MTTIVEQELTCPICSRKFNTTMVSSFSIGEKESDFCPQYLGMSPLPFFVHDCPGCGYVGYEAQFEPIENERFRQKLEKTLRGMETTERLSGLDKYRRMAILGSFRGLTNLEIADAYVKASWCARVEALPGGPHCQEKAVRYFELAIAAREPTTEERPVILYLLGELCRRLDHTEAARKWFDQVDALDTVEPWLRQWTKNARRKLERGDDSKQTAPDPDAPAPEALEPPPPDRGPNAAPPPAPPRPPQSGEA